MNEQELVEQIAIQVAGDVYVANADLWKTDHECFSLHPEDLADEVMVFAKVLAKKLIENREKSN